MDHGSKLCFILFGNEAIKELISEHIHLNFIQTLLLFFN